MFDDENHETATGNRGRRLVLFVPVITGIVAVVFVVWSHRTVITSHLYPPINRTFRRMKSFGKRDTRPMCEGPYKNLYVNSDQLDEVVKRHYDFLMPVADIEAAANAIGGQMNLQDRIDELDEKESTTGLTPEEDKIREGLRARIEAIEKREEKREKGAEARRLSKRANLCGANLIGVKLGEHKLLSEAILTDTKLQGADLQGGDFSLSDMRGARFGSDNGSVNGIIYHRETNLTGADFYGANLDDVTFEVKPGALPIIPRIAYAMNLSELTYESTPASLVELREAFKKGGFRQQQRELTYAIKKAERLHHASRTDSLFSYVLFELPSQWGMSPWRPFKILGSLLFVFALPYFFALNSESNAGIWAVWMEDRVHKPESPEPPVRVTANYPGHRILSVILRRVLVAFYFSFISAAQIGWKELNVGSWISRVQPREFNLKATGWVRVVSGVQSLLSVYLLALWVVTYFGTPFE